jgi:hypothetical protein
MYVTNKITRTFIFLKTEEFSLIMSLSYNLDPKETEKITAGLPETLQTSCDQNHIQYAGQSNCFMNHFKNLVILIHFLA